MKTTTNHAEYAARLAAAVQWLTEAGWSIETQAAFDYAPIVETAMREFNYRRHKRRAAKLIEDAVKRLSDESVDGLPGRPRTRLVLNHGERLTVVHTVNGEAVATLDCVVHIDSRTVSFCDERAGEAVEIQNVIE